MKNYSQLIKQINESIKEEKNNIESTSESISSLVETSINTYEQIKLLPKSSISDLTSIFVLIESFSQSIVDICNKYIASNVSNPDFVDLLLKLRNLQNELLASLIILRSNSEEFNKF